MDRRPELLRTRRWSSSRQDIHVLEGDDPSGAWPGYHGNIYYRTYEDSGGVTSRARSSS